MKAMFKTKKFGVILLLTSTCLIYNLPYLSSTFYTQFLEAFNLSNTQADYLFLSDSNSWLSVWRNVG